MNTHFRPHPKGNWIELDKNNYSEKKGWFKDGRMIVHVSFFEQDIEITMKNLTEVGDNPVRGKIKHKWFPFHLKGWITN